MTQAEDAQRSEDRSRRRDLGFEVLLLLGVSLGASGVFALLRLIRSVTRPGGLANTQANLNTSAAPNQPWLDLAFQVADIAAGVVPALFAIFLLARTGTPAAALGIDRRRPGRDALWGAGLAALIGIPGLGLYLTARAMGLSAEIVAESLPDVWWQIPVLIADAAMNGVLEEVVVVGYLLTRLRELGWSDHRALLASSVLRGSYHLYQGFGGFVGNAVMGLVFGRLFQRTGRVLPLVIAHTILDVVSFVGYALLKDRVGWL